jgi:hypothetical protein
LINEDLKLSQSGDALGKDFRSMIGFGSAKSLIENREETLLLSGHG